MKKAVLSFLPLLLLIGWNASAETTQSKEAVYTCKFFNNWAPGDPSKDMISFTYNTSAGYQRFKLNDIAEVGFNHSSGKLEMFLQQVIDARGHAVANTSHQGFPETARIYMNWPDHYTVECDRTILKVIKK